MDDIQLRKRVSYYFRARTLAALKENADQLTSVHALLYDEAYKTYSQIKTDAFQSDADFDRTVNSYFGFFEQLELVSQVWNQKHTHHTEALEYGLEYSDNHQENFGERLAALYDEPPLFGVDRAVAYLECSNPNDDHITSSIINVFGDQAQCVSALVRATGSLFAAQLSLDACIDAQSRFIASHITQDILLRRYDLMEAVCLYATDIIFSGGVTYVH